MLYSYKNYISILESKRLDNLKSKYVDKLNVPQEIFDYWVKNNNNTLEWLLKIYVNSENPDHILLSKMATEFMNNKDNLSINKITEIDSIGKMRKVLNELTDYDGYDKRFTEGKGNSNDLWVLLNTDEWFIYKPYTYEASEEYGNRKERESNWCTTYDKIYFTEHLGPQGAILYIINKFDPTKDWALKIGESTISAWNYEDINKYNSSDIKEIVEKIWNKNEEPYKILMKYSDEIEDDRPIVNWDDAIENAKIEIRNMSIREIAEQYGDSIIFRHVDDEKYLDDKRDEEIERLQYDWKYESDLVDRVIKILDDFDDWLEEDKQKLFNLFITKMKEANESNENEYYDVVNTDIQDIIQYIKDSYSSKDIYKLVEEVGLQDEIIEQLANEYMSVFNDAEDYLRSIYGRDLNSRYLEELEYYVNFYSLANDIVEDMGKEELQHYL